MKLGGTRQAIHDALSWGYLKKGEGGLVEYLTYLTKIEKSPCGDPTADFLEAGYICAAVNSLDNHLGAWLKFAYGPDEKDVGVLEDILASKLRFDHFPISNAKKHNRLLDLGRASLEDMRLRLRLGREMPIVFYALKMGVDPDNWARDRWGDKRDLFHKQVINWDREGVGQISRVVRSLRGEGHEGETTSDIIHELVAK